MKKNRFIHTPKGFTLIELIVSITLFSIIMVSVMSIFLFSSRLWGKIEINRVMQQNTKNMIETIAEDVRKNGIVWVSSAIWNSCSMPLSWNSIGTKLCTGSWAEASEYFIGKFNEISGDWIRVDAASSCANSL